MGEILISGYQTLRDFANSSAATPPQWDYIELYDDTGAAITRVSITGDARCQWLDVDSDNQLKVEFDVTAQDADIDYPVTISSSAIWNAGSGGTQITAKEQMANVTFNQSGDNVVVTHTLSIPQ